MNVLNKKIEKRWRPHMGVVPFFEGDLGKIHWSEAMSLHLSLLKHNAGCGDKDSEARLNKLQDAMHTLTAELSGSGSTENAIFPRPKWP